MRAIFRQLLTPPVFPQNAQRSYLARLLHTLWLHTTALLLIFTAMLVPVLVVRWPIGIPLMLGMLLGFGGVYGLLRRGHVAPASMLFIFVIWLSGILGVLFSGGQAVAFVAITIMTGLLLGERAAIMMGVLSGIIILIVAVLQTYGYTILPDLAMPPLLSAALLIFGLYLSLISVRVALGAIGEALQRTRSDLHERRRAETSLRLTLQQMAAIVWTTDTRLRFTFSQGAGLANLNLQPDEVVGQALEEYLGNDAALVVPLARRALAGESVTYEHRWGNQTYETRIEPMRDESGTIIGCVAVSLDISHRKTMEEALRLSEERYRMLAENLPDSAIILFDHDLRFVLVDGPELESTGYVKARVQGRTLFEAMPPDFARMVEPNMRAVLAGKHFTAELPFGDQVYHYTYLPMNDAHGATVYGLILAQNITARKRDEAALRESEARYQELFELGMEAIFLIDNESLRILEANAMATELYGYTRDELLQLRNIDLSAEPEHTISATRAASPGDVRVVALRYHRRKDGTIFPVEVSARFFL